ncbi:MAG: hypothetical protein B0W54_20770 [Cellvibrio sp. 79]|nr:MAG: hypothetical protein B0W54_20770 [Cellvibrio sp. 79]
MILKTLIDRNGQYQINLVECKGINGFTVRFHFEVVDTKNGKCIGICDHLNEAKEQLNTLTLKAAS